MHSWHTPEGLINLDCAYAMVANNPEWWYCNQNEYGAYRYETQNTSIAKKVDGKNAEFTVTRMEPFELGASVFRERRESGFRERREAGERFC